MSWSMNMDIQLLPPSDEKAEIPSQTAQSVLDTLYMPHQEDKKKMSFYAPGNCFMFKEKVHVKKFLFYLCFCLNFVTNHVYFILPSRRWCNFCSKLMYMYFIFSITFTWVQFCYFKKRERKKDLYKCLFQTFFWAYNALQH